MNKIRIQREEEGCTRSEGRRFKGEKGGWRSSKGREFKGELTSSKGRAFKGEKKECQVDSAKTPGAGLKKESGKVPLSHI